MKNIMSKKAVFLLLKINTKLTGPDAIVYLTIPTESSNRITWIVQLALCNTTKGFNKLHLRKSIQLIELMHALFTEIDLKHIL